MRGLCFFAAVLAYAGGVSAQSATPLDRFQPAPAGDTFPSVPSADIEEEQQYTVAGVLSFAKSPLGLVDSSGASDEFNDVVGHQLTVHGLASVELFRRLKLDLDIPFTLSQSATLPATQELDARSLSGTVLNDLRVGARVAFLKQDRNLPAASVRLNVWFPTGNDDAFASSGRVRFAPSVVVGAEYDTFAWSAELGRHFDTSRSRNLLGPELVFGAAAGVELASLWFSAELTGSTVTSGRHNAFGRDTTNLEAALGARFDWGPWAFRVAGGPGLTGGIGTPSYRLTTMVAYALSPEKTLWPRSQPNKRQVVPAVSLLGESSATSKRRPSVVAALASSEERTMIDQDGDGVADGRDQCPNVAGDRASDRPGCPLDADADGVADADDACPALAGARSSEPKRHGCPLDSDGDGVVDTDDACPAEAGIVTDDNARNGCPESVRVVGAQIVILDKVEFEIGRAHLLPQGRSLLRQVARVMREHPEVVRVSVEGHTDNVGREQDNIKLSQRRALAVLRALIALGVDERRLETRGYGPRQPLNSNETKEGRAKNRRVEFLILKRSSRNEAAWVDGPVQ